MRLEIKVFPAKFARSEGFAAVADLADEVRTLGNEIRDRVQGRGLNKHGQAFGQHADPMRRYPVKKSGRLKRGETEAQRPIVGYREKPAKTWIRPDQGYPRPKRFYRKTQDNAYLVSFAEYMEDVHGDRNYRFSVSGAAWASLRMSFNRGRKTSSSVKLYFGGSGPALRGHMGETFPNRDKMRLAQERVNQAILDPSPEEETRFLARTRPHVERWLAGLLPRKS
ncbi:MAG: hypothetical protein AMXMBFR64_05060 [Myxococcales bacterium]